MPKSFEKYVKELEKKRFPEFEKDTIIDYEPNNVFYFSPSSHVQMGLITEDIVKDLKNNKTMLSIGAGAAYLEQLLVDDFGIKNEQIVLADISPCMPGKFKQYVFDMHNKWPDMKQKFDYIIFPASILLNVKYNMDERQTGLLHIVKESLQLMKAHGQIRIDEHNQLPENIYSVRNILEYKYPNIEVFQDYNLLVFKI